MSRIYSQFEWVYDYFLSCHHHHLLKGRTPVIDTHIDGISAIVKKFTHGGFLAKITKDRFFNRNRFLEMVESIQFLSDNGIKTPSVLFLTYREYPVFVKAEVALEKIEGMDARDFFCSKSEDFTDEIRNKAFEVGRFVRQLHEIGFLHGDLNLMNLLFDRSDTISILDLEKSRRVRLPANAGKLRHNLKRLERSIRKECGKFNAPYTRGIIEKMHEGYNVWP